MSSAKSPQKAAGRSPSGADANARRPAAVADVALISTQSTDSRVAVSQADLKVWKWAFLCLLAGMLILYWTGGWGTGVHSDEIDMVAYGKANINWYASGGANTRFLYEPLHFAVPTLKYYGSGFEYLAQGLAELIRPGGWEYDIRHMLNQLLAVIGVMFAGLSARRFAGWRAATFTALVLGLTPTFWGLALFDTKDVPFAAGYVAAAYFILRLTESFPKAGRNHLVGLGASLFFASSIRVGAVVMMPLLASLALHAFYRCHMPGGKRTGRKNLLRWTAAVSVSVVVAFIGCILIWPFALLDPLRNIPDAIGAAVNFPERVQFPFAGENYSSVNLPVWYLPRAMGITLPVGILAIFGAGTIGLLATARRRGMRVLLLLLAGSVLPLAYAVYTHMPVYNGWRHLLFIYPPAVAALVSGVDMLVQRVQRRAFVGVFTYAMLAASLLPSTVWSLHNQPYQYQYYNELVGGFCGAGYDYDTDYWQMSLRPAVDWFATRDYVMHSVKPVTVATNGVHFVRLYLLAKYPRLRVNVVKSAFKGRHANAWDYAIFSNVVLPRDIAKHQWPPIATAHSIVVDGIATSVVLADTARYDFQGFNAMIRGDSRLADSLFQRYLISIGYRSDVPTYLGPLDGYIAFTRLSLGDTARAAAYAGRCLKADKLDLVGNITAGLVLMGKGNLKEAHMHLSTAYALDQTLPLVNDALSHLEARGVK